MITKQDKNQVRKKRHARVRNNISGTAMRPRLNVFRSNKNIYAQLIDDVAGVTLVSASSQEKSFEGKGNDVNAAKYLQSLNCYVDFFFFDYVQQRKRKVQILNRTYNLFTGLLLRKILMP